MALALEVFMKNTKNQNLTLEKSNMDMYANPQMEWKNILDKRKKIILETEEILKKHTFKELSGEETGEISKIRLHPADLATDTQELETLDILSEKRTKEIQEIENALERLENGTFGFCLACKDPIPTARLKVLPEARYCLECEEDMERSMSGLPPESFSERVTDQAELSKALEEMGKIWVTDIMQKNPVTVNMHETLETASGLLLDNNIRHLPVVDHKGDIQGIVSDRDLLKVVLRIRPGKIMDRAENAVGKIQIQNVMTKTPETVSPETTLFDAGTLLLENKISCLPVVEGNRLVGIVTDTDFVRLLSGSDEGLPTRSM